MSHSVDFRKHVLKIQKKEKLTFRETAKRFHIGVASVARWHKQLYPAIRQVTPRKIDSNKLLQDVKDFPDSSPYERAKRFGVSAGGIKHAMKRCGVTYKKNFETPKGESRQKIWVCEENKRLPPSR